MEQEDKDKLRGKINQSRKYYRATLKQNALIRAENIIDMDFSYDKSGYYGVSYLDFQTDNSDVDNSSWENEYKKSFSKVNLISNLMTEINVEEITEVKYTKILDEVIKNKNINKINLDKSTKEYLECFIDNYNFEDKKQISILHKIKDDILNRVEINEEYINKILNNKSTPMFDEDEILYVSELTDNLEYFVNNYNPNLNNLEDISLALLKQLIHSHEFHDQKQISILMHVRTEILKYQEVDRDFIETHISNNLDKNLEPVFNEDDIKYILEYKDKISSLLPYGNKRKNNL